MLHKTLIRVSSKRRYQIKFGGVHMGRFLLVPPDLEMETKTTTICFPVVHKDVLLF
jgi:hypothetical protein